MVQFKVSVSCMTFNHAPYITDTMKGFSMQETDFPFVCTIVDDNSTDGEQNVIKDYLRLYFNYESEGCYQKETDYAHIHFARHNTNANCYFAVLLLKQNHYSIKKSKMPYLKEWRDGVPYIAICEGDDYWINSKKLQKQVDYLDAHSECSLVRTNLNRFHQTAQRMEESFFTSRLSGNIKDTYKDYIMRSWFNGTCTWCHRAEVYREYEKLSRKLDDKCFKGDTLLTLCACKLGTIKYLNDITTVYRILDKSASHFSDRISGYNFWASVTRTRTYFANDFNVFFRIHFYFRVCKELFIFIARRLDVNNIGYLLKFCHNEFHLLFTNSKRLKLDL